MQVLWWLAPPLAATTLAMLWATWKGRARDEVRRDDSEEALQRMGQALGRDARTKGDRIPSARMEPTHGVALRRSASRPRSAADVTR